MYIPLHYPSIRDIDNDILLTSINILVLLVILVYSLYYMTCFRSVVQFHSISASDNSGNETQSALLDSTPPSNNNSDN